MAQFIFLVSFFFLLVGCQTGPGVGKTTDVGVWDGKVLMTSGKNSNNGKWAYVTWASDSTEDRMRVDVRAILDIPIATFLLSKDQAHLWLYRENKYYTSNNPKRLFSKLVKFELDPTIFFSFLSHPKRIGSEWQCRKDSKKMLCVHSSEPLKVSLNFDGPNQREIRVKKPGKAFRLRLIRSKVEVHNKMFFPLKSSQFESIKI